jgi:hypothetical protein
VCGGPCAHPPAFGPVERPSPAQAGRRLVTKVGAREAGSSGGSRRVETRSTPPGRLTRARCGAAGRARSVCFSSRCSRHPCSPCSRFSRFWWEHRLGSTLRRPYPRAERRQRAAARPHREAEPAVPRTEGVRRDAREAVVRVWGWSCAPRGAHRGFRSMESSSPSTAFTRGSVGSAARAFSYAARASPSWPDCASALPRLIHALPSLSSSLSASR